MTPQITILLLPTNQMNRMKNVWKFMRESSWPLKGEKLLVISGLNPDEQVDKNKLEYLSQSLAAWDADDDCPEWSDIYDLIEILKQIQRFRASPECITRCLEMLANLKRILERIMDNNRNSMPNDRESMETLDGVRKSIEETIHYWKSARFKPPPKYMQNQNLIESSRYKGTHAFNPNIPPPKTLRQEDDLIDLNAFLSDNQRTSTKNARTLLKDIAQISTIKGRLEADREFFSASWPRGFEVDERNASMITMKEAKEYFQDNKFGGDPVEYMDYVADFVGSTHNNRLLSVQEKSNVLRFACSEVVRKRCGLVHATTLGRYKEMVECIFKRYGSNLEYEEASAQKIQMLDPIKLNETRNLDELVGIMRQFRMVSGSDYSKLIMNSAKKLVPEELYTLFGMENRIKLRKTVKDPRGVFS